MKSMLRHLIQIFFFNNQGFLLIHTIRDQKKQDHFSIPHHLGQHHSLRFGVIEHLEWKMNQLRGDDSRDHQDCSQFEKHYRGQWI